MATTDVSVKKEVTDIAAVEAEILQIVQNAGGGIDSDTLQCLTATVSIADRTAALNNLLQNQLKVVKMPNGQCLFMVNNNTQISGASVEEQAIFTMIEDAKTKGIWIRELRDSGLSQIQLRKVLKSLETKKLIKAIKAVGNAKKCYMLYNLEPDTSVTGGTFYSDQQLDSELINSLIRVCIGFVKQRREKAIATHSEDYQLQKEMSYVRHDEVCDFIKNSNVVRVALSDADVERILDVAILDGAIERRSDGKLRAATISTWRSPLITVPCAACPVVHDCRPGCVIAPETCQYFTDWMALF